MSKHGEKEKKCIEEIQNNIFISKPLNGKTFWEITDEEFEKAFVKYYIENYLLTVQ